MARRIPARDYCVYRREVTTGLSAFDEWILGPWARAVKYDIFYIVRRVRDAGPIS